MKRNIGISTVISFAICITGCNRDGKDGASQFKMSLDLDTSASTLQNVDTVFDKVSYIPLETNSNSLIGMWWRTVFTKDKILVGDMQAGRVLLFDLDGKYLGQISRRGRGPGEYLALSEVMFDEINKRIIVYDVVSKKLIYYDESGALVKEINNFSQNAVIRSIINLPDGGFLCYTFDLTPVEGKVTGSGLWKVNSEGELIESYFTQSLDYDWGFSYQYSNLQLVDNGIFSIQNPNTNDIYHYDSGKGSVEGYINYLQPVDISTIPNEVAGNYFVSSNVQESDVYVYSRWSNMSGDAGFLSFYDKSKKSMTYFKSPFDFHDSALTAIPCMDINSNRKDVLVTAIFGTSILKRMNDPTTPIRTKEVLQKLVAGKSEEEILTMNPILQLLHFKVLP
jgi:hypothetical protein